MYHNKLYWLLSIGKSPKPPRLVMENCEQEPKFVESHSLFIVVNLASFGVSQNFLK